ncbi:MAG: hypothetical protein K2K98_11075 [Muribaculaceae bacterium]|nr:hypothetical protein [Muribaculaceae bacterium]
MGLITYFFSSSEWKFRWLNLKCWCIFHKFSLIVGSSILVILVLVFSQTALISFIPEWEPVYKNKDVLSGIISVLVAIIGASVAYATYDSSIKMKILAAYNERFCNDVNIKAITTKIDEILSTGESVRRNPFDYSVEFNQQVEMFYRFFEELELNIQKGILKRRDVYNLFAFYALKGVKDYVLPPQDYNDHWHLLKRFVERMEPLYLQDTKKY